MRVAVIGLGGTGASAARFLARSGHQVTGFEQFRIGHERASSHGESRIIRYTYPDPLYTRLMGEAYPLWTELEREAQERLLVRCGGLFLGPAWHPELEAIEGSLREAGHAYDILSAQASHARFPALRLRRDEVAIFQADSGFLRATACVRATARLARAHGATILEGARVVEVGATGSCVKVRAQVGGRGVEHEFDAAIVTAGPWMRTLLAEAKLPLVVTRQELIYLRIARGARDFEPDRLPVWIDAATYDYGFPSDGVVPGVKLGLHRRGETVDPDAVRMTVDDEFIRRRLAYAAARLPDLAGEVTHAQVCLYTNTPDEDFIVDEAPGLPGVWLVSGCSGHGFKFTALLGKTAAELATGNCDRSSMLGELSRFSLDRFARPGPKGTPE